MFETASGRRWARSMHRVASRATPMLHPLADRLPTLKLEVLGPGGPDAVSDLGDVLGK